MDLGAELICIALSLSVKIIAFANQLIACCRYILCIHLVVTKTSILLSTIAMQFTVVNAKVLSVIKWKKDFSKQIIFHIDMMRTI